MTIDWLAATGNFAFRHVSDSQPESLLRLMDEERIDLALVSALECVMYRNVQRGNELLVERIAPFRDRLIPAAVINPIYAEAVEDTALGIAEFGARAIRLYPTYHGYALDDPRVSDVLAVARAQRVPVSIAFRIEDERQRHWLVNPPPLRGQEVVALARRHPDVQFVMERPGLRAVRPALADAGTVTNWSVEISGQYMGGPPDPGLRTLVDTLGPERVLYGTDMPLHYARVAALRLESLGLDDTARHHITHGNAARLLRL